jgi:hypothetical protein
MDTQNDVPTPSSPAPKVVAGSPAAGDPAPSEASATTNPAPPGERRLVVNVGIAGTLAERSLPDVPGASSGARARKDGAEFGAAFPEANGRAPAAVAPLETASSAQPEADLLNVILCCFGDESEMPLAELCDFLGLIAAGTECDPREMVEESLRRFHQSGAVTFLPLDGAGGGAAVRLDLSKSPELQQRCDALREEVDAVVRVGQEKLANGRSLEAAVLYTCLEHAVGDRWDDLTRQAIAGQALDRIAASPAYETGDKPELPVRLRKRVPEAPDAGGAKASGCDTEPPPPGRPVPGDAGDDLLPEGSFRDWPRLETAVLLDFRKSPRRALSQLCHTEDDGNGGARWRTNALAAAGGEGGTAPARRAEARAPETRAAAAPEAPAGAAPGAVGLEPRAARRPIGANKSPGRKTSRSNTMKNTTKTAQQAAPGTVDDKATETRVVRSSETPAATGSKTPGAIVAAPSDQPAEGGTGPAPGNGELLDVALDQLVLDPELQSREAVDEQVVNDYAKAMDRGDEFPPLRAVDDGKQLWPWDGRHRLLAARRRGAKTVQVLVTKGTRDDALWLAVAANQDHGLRRSNADKERAVKAALAHPMAKGLSTRAIARYVGVSHQMVSDYRKPGSGATRVSKSDSKGGRRESGEASGTSSEMPQPEERAPLAVPPASPNRDGGAAHRPTEEAPAGVVPDASGAVKTGAKAAESGGTEVADGGAKAGGAGAPPEAPPEVVPPDELLRVLDWVNQVLERYDQSCSELLALPFAQRDRFTTVLGLVDQRARCILEELSKADAVAFFEEDTD